MVTESQYPEHHKFLATAEADQLAELYLLQADLKAAHDALALYLEKFEFSEDLTDEGRIISASLFRDCILLYCSCFSTKEPNKLEPKAVYGHLEDWEPFYRRVLDTRDAFVAHNFGPQRQHHIVVICLEIADNLVPGGFTQVYMRFGGWIADETKRLLSFIAVRQQREQLHPARIDPDERLVGGRRQAGDRPIVTLGCARDGNAGLGVGLEDLEDVLRLRPAKQLLEPRDIFESLFEGFRAFIGVGQVRSAFHPSALLLGDEELAQTFHGDDAS